MIEATGSIEVTQLAASSISARELPADFADALSPSQVRCFMDCQARWCFKYVLHYPDPPNGNLALGKAVHTALGQNFAQKTETREDLPTEGVVALFWEAWAHEQQATEFRDDEDPQGLGACGAGLVARYMDQVAPAIDPAAVELHVHGEIAGVRVRGWIDLLDTDGCVIDIKTSKAKPNAVEPMHRFQVATYRRLMPGAGATGRIDTLVKTKTPQLVSQMFSITAEELRATETLYPAAQQAMRQGRYLPNRLSLMCSRRNCSYWRQCQKEWGGEVPER